jgi:signal transduction histidine kinase
MGRLIEAQPSRVARAVCVRKWSRAVVEEISTLSTVCVYRCGSGPSEVAMTTQLTQVFQNLIQNGVNIGGSREVVVSCRARGDSSSAFAMMAWASPNPTPPHLPDVLRRQSERNLEVGLAIVKRS